MNDILGDIVIHGERRRINLATLYPAVVHRPTTVETLRLCDLYGLLVDSVSCKA